MTTLSIDNLTKIYETPEGPLRAVSDLDLEIRDGELMVFVGPSGCGKTTTLRCIAGLEEVTDGRIFLDDTDITDVPPAERDMAMVFQDYALYPHMTVRENMSFGLKLGGELDPNEIHDRINEVAEMLDISELLEKKPSEISGGQKQRVALGRAITREPSVFLFDEPLTNLDAKLRTQMRTEIEQLQNDLGITSVYVTHDQTEAMTMGDRITVMADGEIQQTGTPEEVYNHPRNRFVAGFIGDPSMNFVEVGVQNTDETTLEFGSQTYSPSEELADLITEHADEKLTAGIRPEDIDVVPEDRDSPRNTFEVNVLVVEPLGNENYVHFELAGQEFVCREAPSVKPDENEHIRIEFEEADLYCFDTDGTSFKTRGRPELKQVTAD